MPDDLMDILWRNALGVVPLAVAVAVVCRFTRCRPATRHTLWLAMLAWLAISPFVPGLGVAQYLLERAEGAAEERREPAEAGLARALPESPVGVEAPAPERTPLPERTLFEHWPARVEAELGTPRPAIVERAPVERDVVEREGAPSAAEQGARRERVAGARRPEGADRLRSAGPWRRAVRPAGPGVESGDTAPAPSVETAAWIDDAERADNDGALQPADAPMVVAEAPMADRSPARSAAVAAADPPQEATAPAQAARAVIDFSALRAAARDWAARLGAVRDAVGALPPAPPVLWIAGSALALALTAGRLLWFRRVFRHAWDAPEDVSRMVDDAATTLGLRRPPRTVMVRDRVSPMIWCGRRPRLVLPEGLWGELDEVGRSAVIHHELAHIKRRDHWTRWGELAIGVVYWWHPVVWWIRRRLREEADLSCDAWVISLMPERRRAYAQALLRTRVFLSDSGMRSPAAGLGATSAGARRFARRLTMVMTSRVKPRASLVGLALAGAIGVLGTVATPLWACPPTEKEKEKRSGSVTVVTPRAPQPPGAHGGGENGSMTTFERHLREREAGAARGQGGGAPGDAQMRQRLESLEQRLERMMRTLERLHGAGHEDAVKADEERKAKTRSHHAAPQARSGGGWVVAGPGGSAQMAPRARSGEADGGATVSRVYTLAPDKMEALTALMVRPDVPIRVRPLGDRLEVFATESQHGEFGRFIEVIGRPHEKRVYRVSDGGKLEALTGLMALESVPLFIRRGDGAVTVYGAPAEQRAFEGFLALIDPQGGASTGQRSAERAELDRKRAHEAKVMQEKEKVREQRSPAKALIGGPQAAAISQAAIEAAGLARECAALRAEKLAMERSANALGREADGLEEQAERLAEAAEASAERIAAMRGREASLDEAARERMREQIAALAGQADGARAQRERLRVESAAARSRALEMERLVTEYEAKTDMMEEQAERLGEELQRRIEEIRESAEALEELRGEELEEALEALIEGVESVLEWDGEEEMEEEDAQ